MVESQSQSGRGVVLTQAASLQGLSEWGSQSQSGRGAVLTYQEVFFGVLFVVSIPVRPGGSPDTMNWQAMPMELSQSQSGRGVVLTH